MRTPRRVVLVAFAAFSCLAGTLTVGVSYEPGRADASSGPAIGILVRGRGNGHGRGMSQFGAYGWATAFGATWQQILDFYYGGTGNTIGALPSRPITVRLTALDGAHTALVSDNGSLYVQGTGGPSRGPYHSLVAREVTRDKYRIWAASSPASSCPPGTGDMPGYTMIADGVDRPEFWTSGSDVAASGHGELVGVCQPGSGQIRYYRGRIRALNTATGENRTINLVDSESYLRGVVPRESPASWGDAAGGAGMNALRAQAVAARSYVLASTHASYAKACDNQNCQVYGGAALRVSRTTVTALEDGRTNRAIAETAGQVVLTPAGVPMRTEYSSSNGGRTAGQPIPAKVDNGDLAADPLLASWSRMFSAAQVQRKYPSIGAFTGISTVTDGAGGDFGGYAVSVAITGTAGTVTRSAWDFRNDWDLYAPWYLATTVTGPAPEAPSFGPILVVGDSVTESIADEFATAIAPAYPGANFQACAGRAMAGAACLFGAVSPQVNADGVGVVNSSVPGAKVAVIALGYNDSPGSFATRLDQMVAALGAKGIERLIFVNLSTRSKTTDYGPANAALAALAAINPAVTILDWNGHSGAAGRWRWFDDSSLCCGIHLNRSGQVEYAIWLREQLDVLRAAGAPQFPAASATPGLPLRRGHEGHMVKVVQRRLNGVLKLRRTARIRVDGTFGSSTATRVKQFQRARGLPATGRVDAATWEALGAAGNPTAGTLRVGSKHPSVRRVHAALATSMRRKVTRSEVYTKSTAALVRTFQLRAGLPVTGRVDAATWARLQWAAQAAR